MENNSVDFVLHTTQRYNNLTARTHTGEQISKREWELLANDLHMAAGTFNVNTQQDYYDFCMYRAKDCDYRANAA